MVPLAGWVVGLLYGLGAVVVDLVECGFLLYDVVWKARDDPRRAYRAMRTGGHFMLVAALLVCAAHWGWDTGLWVWIGCVVLGTVMMIFLLRHLSRLMLGAVPPGLVLGLSLGASALS